MLGYLTRNPARVYGFIVAVLALVTVYVPDFPVSPVLGLAAAGLALFGGEAVQRTEDAKTEAALWADPLD